MSLYRLSTHIVRDFATSDDAIFELKKEKKKTTVALKQFIMYSDVDVGVQ